MDDSSADIRQTIHNRNPGASGNGGTEAAAYEVARSAAAKPKDSNLTDHLMEQVVDRHNLNRAYFRVLTNKGSAGVDGMTVDSLLDWCRANSQALRDSLLDGSYRPSPVKGVAIPKPGGGTRQLGIPTVVDRLVQQAILQVLDPILDPKGCIPKRGAKPWSSIAAGSKRGGTVGANTCGSQHYAGNGRYDRQVM